MRSTPSLIFVISLPLFFQVLVEIDIIQQLDPENPYVRYMCIVRSLRSHLASISLHTGL